MPRHIKGPGGVVYIVPDDTTDAEIASILQAEAGPAPSAETGRDWSVAPALGGMAGGLLGLFGGPPGALAGAAIGAGLGEAGKMYADPAERPTNLGDALMRLVTEASKQAGAEVLAPGAAMLTRPISRRLMQSALKPTDETLRAGAKLGVRTKGDIAEKVLGQPWAVVRPGTVARIQTQVDEINESIQRLLKPAGARGVVIDIEDAARPFNEQAQNALMQATPDADLDIVNRAYEEFARHPLVKQRPVAPGAGPAPGGGFLPIEDAQRLKVGTYQKLKGRYGELGSERIEAAKAGARGLKESIAEAVPEIAAKNLSESELLLVEKAVSDAVNRAGNSDPLGFANAAPTTKRFWLALADRSPTFKSQLARVIRRLPSAAPTVGRAAFLAFPGADDRDY